MYAPWITVTLYFGTKIDVRDSNSYLLMLRGFVLVTIKWHVLQAYCQWNTFTYLLCRGYIYWKLCDNPAAGTNFCFPRSFTAFCTPFSRVQNP